jgi:hypothetical protein
VIGRYLENYVHLHMHSVPLLTTMFVLHQNVVVLNFPREVLNFDIDYYFLATAAWS